MKTRSSSDFPILEPCRLEGYAYQLDPYIGCQYDCAYCYAQNQAKANPGKEVLFHHDLAPRLGQELAGLEPQPIYMGWNSDPYQPCETRYRQTRQALELLSERAFSVCILTKSDLVKRDLDLIADMPGSSVGVSIAFQDEYIRERFEAAAPSNQRRVGALRAVKAAGIRTYALISPVMPYYSDVEMLIDMVAACADTIWIYGLSFDAEGDRNWVRVRDLLRCYFPGLAEAYRRIAFSPDHRYWSELRQELETLKKESGLNLEIHL
jgi:DNA repair photolyase